MSAQPNLGGLQTEVLAHLPAEVREFVRAEKSENTRRSYRSDCEVLIAWCRARGVEAFPLRHLADFLASQARAGVKPISLGRRVAGIRHAHRVLKLPDPFDETARATLAGIRNSLGARPAPRAPLVARDLVQVVRAIPISGGTASDYRDRALLLLGFAAALRRSELVGLNRQDIRFCSRGLRIAIRRSKTDQEGLGQEVAVPYGSDPQTCPVLALRAWLTRFGLVDGPIFRRVENDGVTVRADRLEAQSVARIVKRRAAAAGLDPELFSAHSLRSGFLTSAAAQGASIWKMMDQSRHRSVETVRRYVRNVELFDQNAAEGLL